MFKKEVALDAENIGSCGSLSLCEFKSNDKSLHLGNDSERNSFYCYSLRSFSIFKLLEKSYDKQFLEYLQSFIYFFLSFSS